MVLPRFTSPFGRMGSGLPGSRPVAWHKTAVAADRQEGSGWRLLSSQHESAGAHEYAVRPRCASTSHNRDGVPTLSFTSMNRINRMLGNAGTPLHLWRCPGRRDVPNNQSNPVHPVHRCKTTPVVKSGYAWGTAAVAGPGVACYNRPALASLPSTHISQARRTQGVGHYVVAFQPPQSL